MENELIIMGCIYVVAAVLLVRIGAAAISRLRKRHEWDMRLESDERGDA